MGAKDKLRRVNRRQLVFLVLAVFLGFCGLVLWYQQVEQRGLLSAYFLSPEAKLSAEFRLEVAATPESRAQGLMFRKKLPPDRGMLFIYPQVGRHSFWMENTYISLDIIFLNAEMEVVGVLENLPILNRKSRSISEPSKYAVELLAGSVKREGIGPGWRLQVKGPLPQAL